jgi:hypothetical protein
MLLSRSGLDAQERAAVLASAHNSLKLREVEAAMRTQWSEADIEARDARKGNDKKAHGIFYGEDLATWDEEEHNQEE